MFHLITCMSVKYFTSGWVAGWVWEKAALSIDHMFSLYFVCSTVSSMLSGLETLDITH